ncbi:high mobility group protein dsp1 [Anaeramoeba flamelloides]|uniref:High mobility group protein dsp1 n=1 Tax=Anaeramoeba flamelloides TaxID=1746091 RepID=A0AAV7YL55_9EUKA|nr:high mobility group protein dsp1 [Anaeramoeba flamelloides]
MSNTKLDPEIEKKRPKGRLTSYMFYNKETNLQVRKEYPKMTFTEISKECSKRWRNLSEKERQVFIDKSEQDKLRFEREMKEFLRLYPDAPAKKPIKRSSVKKGGKGRSRGRRDPKKPKSIRTPYQFYSSDVWRGIKEDHPEYQTGDISKEIGRRWKLVPEKDKEKYVKKSDQDKIRNEKEMKEYNRLVKNNKSSKKDDKNRKDKRRDKRRSRKEKRRSRSRRDSKRHHRRNSRRRRRHRYTSSSSGYSSYTGSSSSGYSSSSSSPSYFSSSSSGSFTSDSFSD